MKKYFIIFILSLNFSCNNSYKYCDEYSEDNMIFYKSIVNQELSFDNFKLPPLSNYNKVIEYHSKGAWDEFEHVVRIYRLKDRYVLQIIETDADIENKRQNAIYSEIGITEDQFVSIIELFNTLSCKPSKLYSIYKNDYHDFQLTFKNNQEIRTYHWQNLNNTNKNETYLDEKVTISAILEKLFQISKLTNGKKQVIRRKTGSLIDSVEYEIFLSHHYTGIKDLEIYFDNERIIPNDYGKATIRLSTNDTFKLDWRAKIKVIAIDDQVSFY